MSVDMGTYLLYAGFGTHLGTRGYSRAYLRYAASSIPLPGVCMGPPGYSGVHQPDPTIAAAQRNTLDVA